MAKHIILSKGDYMPKVSVIVPIYNVEKYLNICMESILSQTLKDIEIICIDDGSTDHSGRMLDNIAAKDERVRVLHRQNAGYGSAMNAGLSVAAGEYIGIVESDDYILPDMFEKLYEAASKNHLDMVKADAFYWLESEEHISRIHIKAMEAWYDKVLDELDRNLFFDFYMNIWTGIYKRSFLEKYQIKFHETPGASYQDNGFWFQTCIYANRAMWLNQAFYYYRQDNPTASVRSEGKIMAMTKEYEYVENLLRQRKEEAFLPYCYAIRLLRDRGNYKRIADDKKLEFCQQIAQDYKQYHVYIRGNRGLDEFLKALARNPEEITRKITEMKQTVIRSVEAACDIVVYGAGVHADHIFRALFNEGYSDKVSCFAVTSDRRSERMAARPVLFIEDAIAKHPGALYIIAVPRGTNAYQAMTGKLVELQIDNILSGSDIEENFYIL